VFWDPSRLIDTKQIESVTDDIVYDKNKKETDPWKQGISKEHWQLS
jgi:hypothetical protein